MPIEADLNEEPISEPDYKSEKTLDWLTILSQFSGGYYGGRLDSILAVHLFFNQQVKYYEIHNFRIHFEFRFWQFRK